MALSDSQIEDLRDRADLPALIGRRVNLRKAGKDYVGLCPFHGENTPSFYVVPNKRMWHCFGCGKSGDVFRFYMDLDGLAFPDAVRQVASESGILLVEDRADPEEARRRAHLDALAGLMDRAARFYEQHLWHPTGKPAREHLQSRGVTEEWARRFGLGFAGIARDDLARALDKAGVDPALAVETGLCIPGKNDGKLFDRFHGRLIVPIRIPRPPHGRTVALGGRHLPGLVRERPGYKAAKYINSPETPLYQKGQVLFGLDLARDGIRKEERAVVVEGYFDVLALHQAGFPLAVASCGTSLTPAHLDLLARTAAKEIVFLFDGDAAGLRASARAAELCARVQVPARVATLPLGLDPDDFARKHGLDGLQRLVEAARPALEVLLDAALAELGPNASVEERVRAVHSVRPLVLAAPEGLSRDLYVAKIAEKLGVSDGALRSELDREPARPPAAASAPRPNAPRPSGRPGQNHPRQPLRPRPREDRVDEPPFPDQPPPEAWEESGPPLESRPSGRSAPPAEPSPLQRAAEALARRTFAAEEVITVALLRFPALAATVAQEGILGDFGNPALRAVAEQVIARAQEGAEVQPELLLGAVGDARMRGALQARLTEDAGTLEEQADHLVRVLDRLKKEVRRFRASQALLVQQRGYLQDAASTRAFEEEQQRLLEEARRLHRRIREREVGPSGRGG